MKKIIRTKFAGFPVVIHIDKEYKKANGQQIQNVITINGNLSAEQLFKTTAHELAHFAFNIEAQTNAEEISTTITQYKRIEEQLSETAAYIMGKYIHDINILAQKVVETYYMSREERRKMNKVVKKVH